MDVSVYLHECAVNLCLHDHTEFIKLEMLNSLQWKPSFDTDEFWLCITGLKKSVFTGVYGFEGYAYRSIYNNICRQIQNESINQGWKVEIFTILIGDGKQIGIFMSKETDAQCDAHTFAVRIHQIVQEEYERSIFNGDTTHRNITSLSEPLHDFSDMRNGYFQARKLNDMSFFCMENILFCKENIANLQNQADYHTVIKQCELLQCALDQGLCPQCRKIFETLMLKTVKYSFSFSLLNEVLSYCKHMLYVRCKVYDIIDHISLDSIDIIEKYYRIEECFEALWPIIERVCSLISDHGTYNKTVLTASYFIRQNYQRSISLPEIAEYAGVNPAYLSNQFSKCLGISVRDYVTQIRINESKKLLRKGMLVYDVAPAVGIYDPKYFSRLFKQLEGIRPAEYRDQILSLSCNEASS